MPPRHRGIHQHSKKNNAAASLSSASAILTEARKLKQQAERKPEGIARGPFLERSVQLFENALALSLSASDREEAWFDLAEVLLLRSGSVRAGVSTLTGSPFKAKVKKPRAIEIHLEASVAAATLSRQSHEMFERVCSLEVGGELKEEATVNNGNALCHWAELALEIPVEQGGGVSMATELYSRAFDRYCAALASSPDDVELLTNVGDCCIQRAELVASSMHLDGPGLCSGWESAKELYERGLGAYASACANADVRVGDDLAGLLQNWGVGLFSVAERSPDVEEAIKFAETAQEKLQSAMKFQRADASLCLALGEGLMAVADHFVGNSHLQEQVLKFIKVAVEYGFRAALKIDSESVSALLGLGDAHLEVAKLLSSQGGDTEAGKHLDESVNCYIRAVQYLKEDSEGKYNLKFEEQCDAIYNLACAAALAHRHAEAHEALAQLVSVDAISVKDLVEDSDLVSLRTQDWFISLVHGASN